MGDLGLHGMWLTVNRRCNLRCAWCYALGAGYAGNEDMSGRTAEDLIKLAACSGLQAITFIGGEPTLWPNLLSANRLAKNLGLRTNLATNGFLFSSPTFLREVEKEPFGMINVSLKGGNREQHRQLTQTDTYNGVLAGISNLARSGLPFSVSSVITSSVEENLTEVVGRAIDAGASNVVLDFCSSTFIGEESVRGTMLTPGEAVKCLGRHYVEVDRLVNGHLTVHASIPFCLWPRELLETLKKKSQLFSGCQLLDNSGLIFSPLGEVLPCNVLHQIPLGRYGVNFKDAPTFGDFWRGAAVRKFFQRAITLPSAECSDCSEYDACGGGCPLLWFVFNPQEVGLHHQERM